MKYVILLVYLAAIIALCAGWWKIFEKAGRPGWEAIVPIYGFYICITEIIGKPAWWIVLLFIPIVNWIAMIILGIDVAKTFGKGAGFGLGLALLGPVFAPMLGFGEDKYQGKVEAAA